MKIRLYQEEIDNGGSNCSDCIWYEKGVQLEEFLIEKGCTHPILYDENGDIIKEIEELISKCLENPKHCILMCEKC